MLGSMFCKIFFVMDIRFMTLQIEGMAVFSIRGNEENSRISYFLSCWIKV